MNNSYNVTFSNGQTWSIPVVIIALNKAKYYHSKDDYLTFPEYMILEEAIKSILKEFDNDAYLIEDWARNNMNWSDIVHHAVLIEEEKTIDWENEWSNPVKVEITNE